MQSLFRPSFLGCPVCNTARHGYSAYAATAHTRIGDRKFTGYGCGHEFSLLESLKSQCKGIFGILGVFSHWQWTREIPLVLGKINLISNPTPEGVRVIASFVTQCGGPPDTAMIHKVFDTSRAELAISTSGLGNTPVESLGKEVTAAISLYGCAVEDQPGWAELLYDSLGDFAEHRHSLAVFKLATSLEIALDNALEAFMLWKTLPPDLARLLLNGRRNWHARMEAASIVMLDFLETEEFNDFIAAGKQFLNSVRVERNTFAHDRSSVISHQKATEAFATCLPLYWGIDRLLANICTNQPSN